MNDLNNCFNIIADKDMCDFIELRNDKNLYEYHQNIMKLKMN